MLPRIISCIKVKASNWQNNAVVPLHSVNIVMACILVSLLLSCSVAGEQTTFLSESPPVTIVENEKERTESKPAPAGHTVTPSTSVLPVTPSPVFADWAVISANAEGLGLLRNVRLGVPGSLNAIAWSPDGSLLAAAGEGGVVLFDAASLEILREMDGVARFDDLSFSANGAALVGAGFDLTVQVWDVDSGESLLILHEAGELAALSPNGMSLAIIEDVFDDETGLLPIIRVYEVKSGNMSFSLDYRSPIEEGNPILPQTLDLFFSPDGKKIYIVNILGDIRVVDAVSGRLFSTILNENTRSRFSSGYCEVDGGGDASFAVVCNQYYLDPPCNEDVIDCMPESHRRTVIEVWNAGRGERSFRRVFTDPPEDFLGMAYDGKTAHLGLQYASSMQFWDFSQTMQELNMLEGDHLTRWSGSAEHCSRNPTACGTAYFSLLQDDGTDLLAVAYGGNIEIWDVQVGEMLSDFENDGRKVSAAALGLWQSNPVLALGLTDGTMRIERLADGSVMEEFQAHENRVTDAGFSGGGERLVTGGLDSVVRFWQGSPVENYQSAGYSSYYGFVMDAAGAHLVMENDDHELALFGVVGAQQLLVLADRCSKPLAISSDGLWLAMPDGASQGIGVRHLSDGSLLRIFPSLSGQSAGSLALSPDGSLLAGGEGNALLLWQINDTAVWQQKEFEGDISSLAFSPDGCLLAVGDIYGTGYLYDVESGQIIWGQKAHNGAVQKLTFREDGLLLLSIGRDGSAALWGVEDSLQLPYAAPADVACRFSSLPLTSTPVISSTPTLTSTLTATATLIPFKRQLYLMEPHMAGEDVWQLQARLLELGFDEVGVPDGDFGEMTDEAVRAYQGEYGLVVDGVVGELTWSELFGDY